MSPVEALTRAVLEHHGIEEARRLVSMADAFYLHRRTDELGNPAEMLAVEIAKPLGATDARPLPPDE